jgi:glycosyltransferase involved in cell wall biosynthesis
MSLGIPFVQFDLTEGRRIAGDAALYAENNDPADLARQLLRIADDPQLAERMHARGRERARSELSWDRERAELLAAYAAALGEPGTAGAPALVKAAAP